jgi:GT2 family glycosyltransferase
MSPPSVSVIVPVYRDWDRLALCLQALSSQSLDRARYEVIVVDNEPEQRAVLPNLPDGMTLIHEPEPGSYRARNAGVRASRGRYLAFTDSDCVPAPDWLRNGLASLEAEPGARITGPIPLFREPGGSRSAFLYESGNVLNQRDFVRDGFCATANLLVGRDVFDRVGEFDGLVYSGGDKEWGLRATRLGVPLRFSDDVAVGHPARPRIADVVRRKRRFAGASAAQPEPAFLKYVLPRIAPPRRRGASAAGGPSSRSDRAIFYAMRWLIGLSEAAEFTLVRARLKRPNRA